VIQSLIVNKRCLLLGLALAATPAIHAQNTIGEVFASDASVHGSVVLSGNGAHVLSGSQVTAGDGVAVLKLDRGGEVRICPKTNLSLSVDSSGKALVLGLNAGSMEVDYSLSSAADSLITPDFRLQLISPGTFHLAISVAPTGDTCMRSLHGNDASVFIAEMMGSDTYQLSPGKNVMFRAGRISGAVDAPAVCGCPVTETPVPEAVILPNADLVLAPETTPTQKPSQETAPKTAATLDVPQNEHAESHLEAESTFVYHGNEAVQDTYSSVARLSLSTDNSRLALALLPKISGPAAITKPPEKNSGKLHRFRQFVGRLFGR
jgi:hypothetical protein